MDFGTTKSNSIQLYGTIGEFETNNSNIVIKYFSTIANNREEGSAYHDLLKRLSPMREKTETSSIEDLQQLLQRDLNDNRVAKELIPYLLNKHKVKSHVTFFPSVLSVLMPSDFLKSRNDGDFEINYPVASKGASDDEITYSGMWNIEQFKDTEGNLIPLAKLSINLSKTEIIVIDGQHRANAFRAISKSFDGRGKNQIYQNFYSHLEPDLPKDFKADLPVTLLWFESKKIEETEIKPDLISRQLFIDVNNTSKYISTSRLILLNDKNPSSLFTRFFYSNIAQNHQFNNNTLSLFHSGFDYDDNLKNRENPPSPFALIFPESLNYAFDWFFFGDVNFNKLYKWKAGGKSVRTFKERLEEYFDDFVGLVEIKQDNDNNKFKEISIDMDLESVEKRFNLNFGKKYYEVLRSFPLCSPHFDACVKLQQLKDARKDEWATESWQEAWDKLFKGGEGLYYVFKRLQSNQAGYQYYSSAQKIIEVFLEERNSQFNIDNEKVIKAYETFRSIAFQTGLAKSIDAFHRSNKTTFEVSITDFQKRIDGIDKEIWVYALTDFKGALIKEIQPADWPMFKNIILRLIQVNGEFYSEENMIKHSPEVRIIKNMFLARVATNVRVTMDKKIGEVEYEELDQARLMEIHDEVKYEVKNLYGHLDLTLIDTDYLSHSTTLLKSKTAKFQSKDENT